MLLEYGGTYNKNKLKKNKEKPVSKLLCVNAERMVFKKKSSTWLIKKKKNVFNIYNIYCSKHRNASGNQITFQ